MNLIELDRALKQLRLGGMAAVLETRLRQAQAEPLAPIDLLSCLVSDELARRGERLLERRKKQAQFRDSQKTLAARGRTTENARAVTRCAAPERGCHSQASRAIRLPGEETARHPA